MGYCDVAWVVLQHRKTDLIFFLRLVLSIHKKRRLGCFAAAWIFLQHQRPVWVQIHTGLWCEPEGLLPDGGLSYPTNGEPNQTGEPRGLAPSGGISAAKPQVFLCTCAPAARSPKGEQPPSHEACCRMAVFSIQLTRELHQTGEPRGLAPSGGNSAANLLSLEYPPRFMGAVRGAGRREEARVQWTQPPQAVSDRQPSTETRI